MVSAGDFRNGVTFEAVTYTHLDVYKRQDHDKRFQVQVRLNSNVIGSGVGLSLIHI